MTEQIRLNPFQIATQYTRIKVAALASTQYTRINVAALAAVAPSGISVSLSPYSENVDLAGRLCSRSIRYRP